LPATTRPALQSQYGPIVVPHEHPADRFDGLSDVLPTAGQGMADVPPRWPPDAPGLVSIGDRAARCSQYQVIGKTIAVDLIPGRLERPRSRGVEVVDLRETGDVSGWGRRSSRRRR